MSQSEEEFSYSGSDNLEVMLEAERYNAFLTKQVIKHRVGTGPVLDFGAGLGTFSEMVRDQGVPVECLELDKRQHEILTEKGFRAFRSTDEIPAESYDYIFSLNVFEHIECDTDAIAECQRILRPGGRMYIYVPAFQVLFGDMDRKVGHFRRYTRKSLQTLIESSDLVVERTEYVDIAGFFATLLYNGISSEKGDLNKGSVRIYDRFVFPVSRLVDLLTHPFAGKNAVVVAHKPRSIR